MFTGIVSALGRIHLIEATDGGCRITIDSGWEDAAFVLGESIAIDGACMTVVTAEGKRFVVEVSSESLARTTLGSRQTGDRVNLERALAVGERLGGHFVTGHIDDTGCLIGKQQSGNCIALRFEISTKLSRYIVEKGSIAIDGISLTVNRVEDRVGETATFEVMIVPHTLQETCLSDRQLGDPVNLEVDMLGKYVERLLVGRSE